MNIKNVLSVVTLVLGLIIGGQALFYPEMLGITGIRILGVLFIIVELQSFLQNLQNSRNKKL